MHVKIADDVVYRDVAGEAVILNLASGVYFGLDEVGSRIWHLVAESGDPARVIVLLREEYDVTEEQARQDFDGLVQQLADKGLVRVED